MSDLALIAYLQFSIGQIHFTGFAFLHFCKKYDICNRSWSTLGCTYGKNAQLWFRFEIFTFGNWRYGQKQSSNLCGL